MYYSRHHPGGGVYTRQQLDIRSIRGTRDKLPTLLQNETGFHAGYILDTRICTVARTRAFCSAAVHASLSRRAECVHLSQDTTPKRRAMRRDRCDAYTGCALIMLPGSSNLAFIFQHWSRAQTQQPASRFESTAASRLTPLRRSSNL